VIELPGPSELSALPAPVSTPSTSTPPVALPQRGLRDAPPLPAGDLPTLPRLPTE
jgi:hypothetical protein